MAQVKTDYKTIDEYIAAYPDGAGEMLSMIRALVHEAVPDINEKISWQMPTFYKDGIVIQFAAHKKHIGVYPGPEAIEIFMEQIEESGFKWSKGGFQIPYDRPIPNDLLRGVVLFRLAEVERHLLEKEKKRKGRKNKMNIVSIKGMSCSHCEKAVREALEGIGLENVEVDAKNGVATFAQSDIDFEVLRQAIDEAGFEIG